MSLTFTRSYTPRSSSGIISNVRTTLEFEWRVMACSFTLLDKDRRATLSRIYVLNHPIVQSDQTFMSFERWPLTLQDVLRRIVLFDKNAKFDGFQNFLDVWATNDVDLVVTPLREVLQLSKICLRRLSEQSI